MSSNIERYKEDLDKLVSRGKSLQLAMQFELTPDSVKRAVKKQTGDKAEEVIRQIPSFKEEYQTWYSEAQAIIKQILPDRLSDFVRLYEKPRSRKQISYENYTIEDYLQGLTLRRGPDRIVGPDAAFPRFNQQLAILQSAAQRFRSSLFNMRQLVQADVFDSELEAAQGLASAGFNRAAGALAGVVLERHLSQVSHDHGVAVRKRSPGIADLSNLLKDASAIDTPTWRFIQHLADIRNLCDHDKKAEPSSQQVQDLLEGVAKITKTVY